MKFLGFLLLFLSFVSASYAQTNPWYPEEDTASKYDFWHSPPQIAKSVALVGGYELGGFTVGMLKFVYEKKHWSGGIEFFYQQHQRTWDSIEVAASSEGKYQLWGFGVSGRYYTGKSNQGGYVELGAGSANPKLSVLYQDTQKKLSSSWKFQYLNFGAGAKIRFRPKGFFAEAGYRGWMVIHRTPLLYTDEEPPAFTSSKAPSVLYHAWWLKRFRVKNQFVIGVGYSF